ncbi:MAG: penicillin-insensitive murein endopeptidase, partial [Pseudomonadota bacterium]
RRKPKPGVKPKPRKKKREITLAQLPRQCRVVLTAEGTGGTPATTVNAVTYQPSGRIATPSFRAFYALEN